MGVEGCPRSAAWHELYRDAGGSKLAKVASVNFIRPSEEARRRIERVARLGFEEILIGRQFGAIEEIERERDFLGS